MNPLNRILFDLDGTLTDSRRGIVRSIQQALAELGREQCDERELVSFIGAPMREIFAKQLGTRDDNLIRRAVSLYGDHYRREGIFENEVYEGIRDMLSELRANGHVLNIVTSKATCFANEVLSHFQLAEYFAGVYGSNMDGTNAHKVDLIRDALRAEQIETSTAVMVGDRKHDMLGARANGIFAVGVLWGYGSKNELEANGADDTVDTPSAVPPAIRRIGQRCTDPSLSRRSSPWQ